MRGLMKLSVVALAATVNLAVTAAESAELVLKRGQAAVEKVWNFPVEKGTAVRFTVKAKYSAEDGRPPFNDLNVIASWVDARAGERHRRTGRGDWTDPSETDPGASWKYLQRDYVRHADVASGAVVTRTFSDTINVPTNVVSVDVECFVKGRPCVAKILEVKAETVAALPKRVARIVLANPRRGGPSTIAARGRQVEKALDEVFAKVEKPDFVMACSEVFPESINKDPSEQSEPVPEGPTSRLLARYAKEHGCYVAGGLCEKDKDGVAYNAVVLFDRTGELVGTYRKVHLTTGEFLGGKRAGDAFPVFETDFGKVGFCICWDNFFPETMRQLQLNGAELVVFPIAATGTSRFEHVFRARCIDTGLPLAIQIRQGERPNRILGRDGETLAETFVENEPCWADIDLAARTRTWWLSVGAAYGDPYQLYDAERRPDVYQSPSRHADIGDVLRASVAAGDVAGVVSVVSGPDYSMRIDCAGYADVERKIPMRPDTVFALFSCSKSVCGTAVMILVGEGKLGLDDPVSRYIPEFADVKVEEKGADGTVRLVSPKRPITVRDVMSHVSGSRFQPVILRRDFPLVECARRMAKTPFKFQPGETFSYNNAGIDTGGAVVEVVSGMDFESFCQARIFGPLGMKDTTFTPNADQIARLARCYNADGKPFADQAKAGAKYAGRPYGEQTLLPAPWKVYPAPSAGLYSTPLDFSRYSQMLAHRGEWQGVRLIPEKLFRETYVVKQTADSIESPYTIGNWIRGEWFGHSGAMKSDQRVNVRTGHSRCYFAQIMPPGGEGFERSKDAWNLAVDAIQCAEGATPCLDHSTKRTSGGRVKAGR